AAGDEGCIGTLPRRSQTFVERNDRGVPTERCRESGGEEGSAEASSTACNATSPLALTAVVVEGGKACERRSFLAADPAELRHPDQHCERRAVPDPRNAEHQIKSTSDIVCTPELPANVAYRGTPSRLQPGNVGKHHAPQGRLVDMFKPGF